MTDTTSDSVYFPDGRYPAGSPEANTIGFTKGLFWGHFTRKGNIIWIQFIGCNFPNSGFSQNFVRGLIATGFDVRIVQPNAAMTHICKKNGLTCQGWAKVPNDNGLRLEQWRNPSYGASE